MIRALTLLLLLASASGWQRHASPVPDDLHTAFFASDSTGWVVAHQSGAVLQTRDGGATWQVQTKLGPGFLESIHFLDARTGWICGDKGRLYHTADGGATWEDRSLGKEDLSLYAVRFLDARRGFLAGMDTTARKGALLETGDGGATWTRREDLPPTRSLTDSVVFLSPSVGFAGGFGGILATRDGGKTWRLAHASESGVVRGLSFPDERTGWAVGHEGLVIRTKDGGETWERVPLFTKNRLRSVQFVDAKRGWITGDANAEPGVLFETGDGGETWRRVEIEAPDLHHLAASPGRIWIVGKSGTILSQRPLPNS